MSDPRSIRIEDFSYDLPAERIAFFPAERRDHSKLLVYRGGQITDSRFDRLPDFLPKDSLLILNDSKVIHARLLVRSATGAAIEIFCLEPVRPASDPATAFAMTGEVTWKCLVGNAKRWKHPLFIDVPAGGRQVRVTATRGANLDGASFEVTFAWDAPDIPFAVWLEHYGKIPLPPYIRRAADETDELRYQTVYAEHDGSVAAPTAGLHFTDDVFAHLHEKGIATDFVTLHVGAGTFKPVTSETIGDHYMHEEKIVITEALVERLRQHLGKPCIAVGTTVARTLESIFLMGAKLRLGRHSPLTISQWEAYDDHALGEVTVEEALDELRRHLHRQGTDLLRGATSLIILPTYQPKMAQGIITNFHQPQSTLLLLISAFVGDNWREIYRHALRHGYRFLSYGDSNLYLP